MKSQDTILFCLLQLLFAIPMLVQAQDKPAEEPQDSVLELRLAESESSEGLEKIDVAAGKAIFVHSEPVIRESDIESVARKPSLNGGSDFIAVRLTVDGGKKLSKASASHLGKPMAIMFKGKLISAPVIQSKLERDIVISGRFTEAKINQMLNAIVTHPCIPKFNQEDLNGLAKRLDRAHERRKFSGTVLIAVDGKIVFEHFVGFANINDKTQFQENSSFRLASVSKQFTAMGIMILKEQGKLEFDDDITKYLPELPYKDITIRHLLNHTGGLPDYMSLFAQNWDKENPDSKKKTASNQDTVDLLAKIHPEIEFEPGKRFQYSNTGYVLLGRIIAKASGTKIQDFFKQQVFQPLKMEDSYAFEPGENFKPAHRVFGFAYSGSDRHVDNDWNYLNGMVGDGGIYCSARDLLKWDQALYGEKLVSQATLNEAFTSGKRNDGRETGYGFGWQVSNSEKNGLTVSHSGAWVGFQTFIKRQPDRKFTIIVLSNSSTPQMDQITAAIQDLPFASVRSKKTTNQE